MPTAGKALGKSQSLQECEQKLERKRQTQGRVSGSRQDGGRSPSESEVNPGLGAGSMEAYSVSKRKAGNPGSRALHLQGTSMRSGLLTSLPLCRCEHQSLSRKALPGVSAKEGSPCTCPQELPLGAFSK